MMAQFRIEAIGGVSVRPRRWWAAEIVGYQPGDGLVRRFLRYAQRDDAQANSKGTRGVWLHFLIESGRVYEVCAPQTWQRSDQFFCRVTDDGAIERVGKAEVYRWLNTNPPSVSTF